MEKATRLNQELIFLSDRTSFQLQDLMQEFSISKRTALRDISSLEAMGMAFYSERGCHGGYHIIGDSLLTRVYFNNEEIQAIFFAIKAMTQLQETPFSQSFNTIKAKLTNNLSPQRQTMLTQVENAVNFYTVAAVHHNPFLHRLMMAIINHWLVTVTFKDQVITLQPIQLFYRDGYWLCSAWCFEQAIWWNWRVDLIKTCTIIRQPDQMLDSQQLMYQMQRFKRSSGGTEFSAKLTPHGRTHFMRHPYPHFRLVTDKGQDYLVGAYTKKTFNYVVDYLLDFGTNAKILQPTELVEAFKHKLHQMLNQY